MLAEQSLREGRVTEALAELQDLVRKTPDNAEYRVFLFQLLCVLGEWERARNQLKVLSELTAGSLPLVHVYGTAITCELLRRDVFAGARTPLLLGEPLPWVALLIQALSESAHGRTAEAGALRAEALEKATAVAGEIDGHDFDWIADADSRLGPVCEAIVDGRYYWVPFERIRSIRLGRKTEWDEVAPDTFHGRGQRMFATAGGEYALLSAAHRTRRRGGVTWSRSARGMRCSPPYSTD